MGSFPKIFHIGNRNVLNIFEGDVEITEKIDGSQFGFGNINGELVMHTGSRGTKIYIEKYEKMFTEAVNYVGNLFSRKLLPLNLYFYAEYLKHPKHNVLAYDNIPKNNLALFGVKNRNYDEFMVYEEIKNFANILEIDVVPLLFEGKIEDREILNNLLDTVSLLGGQKIEGIVIKNYEKQLLIGGHHIPIVSAKYVSEKFKEIHNAKWKKNNTGVGRFEVFKEKFRSEARWNKAIQHLREKGELLEDPKDIGKLMKEINIDIIEECQEEIKDFLWKEYGKSLLRHSTRGFPEWYKNQLLKKAMDKL